MNFREQKAIYYLSPFKILAIDKIFGSGFPYSGNFNYVHMWEYE